MARIRENKTGQRAASLLSGSYEMPEPNETSEQPSRASNPSQASNKVRGAAKTTEKKTFKVKKTNKPKPKVKLKKTKKTFNFSGFIAGLVPAPKVKKPKKVKPKKVTTKAKPKVKRPKKKNGPLLNFNVSRTHIIVTSIVGLLSVASVVIYRSDGPLKDKINGLFDRGEDDLLAQQNAEHAFRLQGMDLLEKLNDGESLTDEQLEIVDAYKEHLRESGTKNLEAHQAVYAKAKAVQAQFERLILPVTVTDSDATSQKNLWEIDSLTQEQGDSLRSFKANLDSLAALLKGLEIEHKTILFAESPIDRIKHPDVKIVESTHPYYVTNPAKTDGDDWNWIDAARRLTNEILSRKKASTSAPEPERVELLTEYLVKVLGNIERQVNTAAREMERLEQSDSLFYRPNMLPDTQSDTVQENVEPLDTVTQTGYYSPNADQGQRHVTRDNAGVQTNAEFVPDAPITAALRRSPQAVQIESSAQRLIG